MELIYHVQKSDDGHRAVDVLTSKTGMSRLLTKKVRLYGSLLCNEQAHRMIDPVHEGDLLVARYEPNGHNPPEIRPVAGVQVRYQDDWVLAVAKPAGLVTHPTYLHDTDALTAMLADRPLHPVGRLDRDTSGLVLIALNGHAHHVISCRPQVKQYLALIHGRLPGQTGLIRAPIQRSKNSIMLREVSNSGAEALTLWKERRYYPSWNVSLVSLRLLTGRTHQLRLHCQACGCPIVGDSLYGGDRTPDALDLAIGRQALHAVSLDFHHPLTDTLMRVTAPLPADFRKLLYDLA
ncbi:MAG: RluA family pseudouridine synthase [Bacillota bacterium]|nr:RluA family pseudouridine synthase [Bacillota bacterium]